MLRSTVPCIMTAGPFFILDLATYLAVKSNIHLLFYYVNVVREMIITKMFAIFFPFQILKSIFSYATIFVSLVDLNFE